MLFFAKVPIVPIIVAVVVVAIIIYFVFFHKGSSVVVAVDTLPGAIKAFYAAPIGAKLSIPGDGDTTLIELSKDAHGIHLDVFAGDDHIDYEGALIGLLHEWEYDEVQVTEEDGIAYASVSLDDPADEIAELCLEILDELFHKRGRDQVTVTPQGFVLAA